MIEELYLSVNIKNKSIKYEPVWELDPYKLHKTGCLNTESITLPYTRIGLSGEEVKDKTISFINVPSLIKEGVYSIDIIIKTNNNKPRVYKTFNFLVEKPIITLMSRGKGFYLKDTNPHIILEPEGKFC